MTLTFFADGDPKAQPRVKVARRGKFSGVYTPKTADGWKMHVRVSALNAWAHVPVEARKQFTGAVSVTINVFFPRPLSHYRTGKHAGELRPDAPQWHTSKPDRDNVDKAILDALTDAGLWADDCQVCAGQVTKRYADTKPGALIEITSL